MENFVFCAVFIKSYTWHKNIELIQKSLIFSQKSLSCANIKISRYIKYQDFEKKWETLMAENFELIQCLSHFQSSFIHLEPKIFQCHILRNLFLGRKQRTFSFKNQLRFGTKIFNFEIFMTIHEKMKTPHGFNEKLISNRRVHLKKKLLHL